MLHQDAVQVRSIKTKYIRKIVLMWVKITYVQSKSTRMGLELDARQLGAERCNRWQESHVRGEVEPQSSRCWEETILIG